MAAFNNKHSNISFNEVVNNFYKQDNQQKDYQKIIFVSIGCEANLLQKGKLKLDDSDNQQYIPFLQHIKQLFPHIELHLVLIDPYLYNPPYCVQSSMIHFIPTGVKTDPDKVPIPNNWSRYEYYSNVYYNNADNIYVYAIREELLENENTLNNFKLLNKFCISTNNILLVHDFSGYGMAKNYAYLFDSLLEGYKDRIIYDITIRSTNTCYVDLLNPIYFLDVNYQNNNNNTNGYIRLNNPYNIPLENLNNEYINSIDQTLKLQILYSINNRLTNFLNIICTLYRQLYLICYKNDIIDIDESFLLLKKYYSYDLKMEYIHYTINNKQSEFMKIILDILKGELYKILYIYYHNHETCIKLAYEYTTNISDSIYLWQSNIQDKLKNIFNSDPYCLDVIKCNI